IGRRVAERYDLVGDAGERTKLAGRSPERDRTLAGTLRGLNATAPGQRQAEDAAAAARLRALGYVSGNAPAKARYTEADDPKQLVGLDEAIHRGVQLYQERRFQDAEQVYGDLIDRRPDMALAYRHLAFVAWETGDPQGAI